MIVYQPTLNILELQKVRTLIMFLVKNKREYILLNINHCMLLSWIALNFLNKKVKLKFNKDPLAVEQNNYATKIVNAYIVYDLDNWPYNRLKNISLKSCLFGATNEK